MPKTIKKEILKALGAYQQRVADILTKQGVKAHVAGDLKGYKKLAPIAIDFGSVQKGAKEFGVKYGALLKKEGATMIHGKKVAWLAESMKDTRSKVADIINEGVRTGKGTDAIARELRGTLIRDKNYEYKRIARTETGNIQAAAADKRYKEEGVEEVDWLCGQKPCPKCAPYCGKRYKIGEAPDLLVHPNCTCDKAPVVTKKVRVKIDKKSMETKEKQKAALFKLAPAKRKLGKPKIKKPLAKKPLPKKDQIDPLEQLKKEERANADELWKKTKKDGNEHMKVTNSKTTYFSGNKHGISWKEPITRFKGHHTHPNWDCPLGGVDIGNYLKIPNMDRMTASSSKRIYVAFRTSKTIVPRESVKFLAKKHQKMSNGIYSKARLAFRNKTGRDATEAEASELLRGAMTETNEQFAKEYKFKVLTFGREG